jgi:uncharacterized protein YqiB (DUF1249 family)
MSRFSPRNKSYWLAKLCEANYDRLIRLAPDLEHLQESRRASAHGKPALYLRLLDRSPHTLTVELTHAFGWAIEASIEPAVRIRVYLDARAVEVLSDHCRPEIREALRKPVRPQDVLDYKWSLNYFLSRWLDHCLQNNYRFTAKTPAACISPA